MDSGTHRASGLFSGSLTLLLGAVDPLKRRQGEALLELDRTAGHNLAGIRVPVITTDPLLRMAGLSWIRTGGLFAPKLIFWQASCNTLF